MDGKTLTYFGTNLTTAGHYCWTLYPDEQYNGFYSYSRAKEDMLEFHADYLMRNWQPNGSVNYCTINGLNIIAIAGSPYDKRGGCKSVFWCDKETSFDELKQMILSYPASKQVVEKIGVPIKW